MHKWVWVHMEFVCTFQKQSLNQGHTIRSGWSHPHHGLSLHHTRARLVDRMENEGCGL